MRARRLLQPQPARHDLPGAGAVLLLAAAAALPGPRDVLLALATAAAVVWIGADAVRTDRHGPRARLVMAIALLLLAALPALLLAADDGLWNGPRPSLDGGLALWAVGILSVAVGSRLAGTIPLRAVVTEARAAAVLAAQPRGYRARLVVTAIVLVSLAAFMHRVGGPIAYLKNLNNSAAATFGLTYFIWGISFAKFGAFAYLGEAWARGARPGRYPVAAAAVAIVLLLFLGSRLLLLVALVQLLLLYAALRPLGRRFKLTLLGTALAGAVAFLAIGEFRRWENVSPRPSFTSYLVDTGLPQLPRTYVNDYADAVRLSVLARRVVPSRAPYEDGKELLRVLLQPIPGTLRPTISTAPALTATFTSGHKNGNALPVPIEGYIEFGFAGAVLFSLLLGLAAGLVDRLGAGVRSVGTLCAAIAAGTGCVIVMRGSLHQGIALAAIDVVGFAVAHRILFARPAAAGPGAGAGADQPAAAAKQPLAVQ